MNEGDTFGTLRFGNRAKAIQNKPKANIELTIEQYKKINTKLEEERTHLVRYTEVLERVLKNNNIPEEKWEAEKEKLENPDLNKSSMTMLDNSVIIGNDNTATKRDCEILTDLTKMKGVVEETIHNESLLKIAILEADNKNLEGENESLRKKLTDSEQKIVASEVEYLALLKTYTSLEESHKSQTDLIHQQYEEIKESQRIQNMFEQQIMDRFSTTPEKDDANTSFRELKRVLSSEKKGFNFSDFDLSEINRAVDKVSNMMKFDEFTRDYMTIQDEIRNIERFVC